MALIVVSGTAPQLSVLKTPTTPGGDNPSPEELPEDFMTPLNKSLMEDMDTFMQGTSTPLKEVADDPGTSRSRDQNEPRRKRRKFIFHKYYCYTTKYIRCKIFCYTVPLYISSFYRLARIDLETGDLLDMPVDDSDTEPTSRVSPDASPVIDLTKPSPVDSFSKGPRRSKSSRGTELQMRHVRLHSVPDYAEASDSEVEREEVISDDSRDDKDYDPRKDPEKDVTDDEDEESEAAEDEEESSRLRVSRKLFKKSSRSGEYCISYLTL